MLKYVLKRLGYAVIILFGVSVIIYILIRLMPSNYIDDMFQQKLLDGNINQEDIDRMKEIYGILDNSFTGILKGYFQWLGNLVRLDLGMSFKHGLPVEQVIASNMHISFTLAILAEIITYSIAIPLGIKTARKQYGVADYSVTTAAMIGISLPSFFLSGLLMKVFCIDLGILPLQGLTDASATDVNSFMYFLDIAYHLILPVTVIVILGIGGMMRYTRTNTLEVLNADYIRTARAKGLSERTVIYKHAFRNTLIPLVTMFAGIIPGMFGGSMIIETVFAIPGIGKKAYEALMVGDIPFVMGYFMFLAVLTVIGTLLSDLMYAVVDPRVKVAR